MMPESMKQTIINGKAILIGIIANPATGKLPSIGDSVSVKFKIENDIRMLDWEWLNEDNGNPKIFKDTGVAICAVNAAVERKLRKIIPN